MREGQAPATDQSAAQELDALLTGISLTRGGNWSIVKLIAFVQQGDGEHSSLKSFDEGRKLEYRKTKNCLVSTTFGTKLLNVTFCTKLDVETIPENRRLKTIK